MRCSGPSELSPRSIWRLWTSTSTARTWCGIPRSAKWWWPKRSGCGHTIARNSIRLLGLIPEPHRGTARYLEGRAAPVLVDACAEHDALLVATHGRTGFSHFFLGSIAERLVRLAPVPVMVLRLGAQEAA